MYLQIAEQLLTPRIRPKRDNQYSYHYLSSSLNNPPLCLSVSPSPPLPLSLPSFERILFPLSHCAVVPLRLLIPFCQFKLLLYLRPNFRPDRNEKKKFIFCYYVYRHIRLNNYLIQFLRSKR